MVTLTSKTAILVASIVVVLLIAAALFVLIPQKGQVTETSTGQANEGGGKVILRGSGATFLQPQLEAWIEAFMRNHENIVIEYTGVGSGAGQQQFFSNLTDFCGSDPPLSRDKWEKYQGKVLQLPVVLGAVVLVYNVPEIPEGAHLNLTGEVIAQIYTGEIRFWDDARIKELNPAVADRLPHKEIVAVHRSDSSGSTQIFTTFLHKAAPDKWPESMVSKVVDWPVDKKGMGVGAKGNPGVVAEVMNTKYSIGYVELAYALKNNLPTAAVMNKEGAFVLPTEKSIQSAASQALKLGYIPSEPDEDFSRELEAIVYASGRDSYPIAAFSHIFLWSSYGDKEKAEALKEFLQWLYSNDSSYIIEGYVPVPKDIKNIWLGAINTIKG